jgi:hypothetical protein
VSEPLLRRVIVLLGAGQLALGAWIAISPGTFFDAVADFGTRNDHYLRDVSTFYLAFGLVLIAAARRPSWRAPVLAFGLLQYALHAINHLIDIGDADPGWIGPVDFIAIALTAGLFAYLLRESARRYE